jgi:hypothetical protein
MTGEPSAFGVADRVRSALPEWPDPGWNATREELMTVTRQSNPRLQRGGGRPGATRSARIGSWTWSDPVVRGWAAVGFIPVFALLALGAAEGVYTLLGYRVGVDDAPAWADRTTGLAGFLVFLVPCLFAVRCGNRARVGRDPRGWAPLAVGALVGGWWLAAAAFAFAGSF